MCSHWDIGGPDLGFAELRLHYNFHMCPPLLEGPVFTDSVPVHF